MNRRLAFTFLSLATLLNGYTVSAEIANATKRVFFENIKDGDTVHSPLTVKMGAVGIAVSPAGEVKDGAGHHHLIVDGNFIDAGQIVAADATHLHFGKGQTETTLDLPKGKHSLTLQFADGAHKSFGKDLSATVSVMVE